jgi:hypothetical protein
MNYLRFGLVRTWSSGFWAEITLDLFGVKYHLGTEDVQKKVLVYFVYSQK